jgi:hypothetical protein
MSALSFYEIESVPEEIKKKAAEEALKNKPTPRRKIYATDSVLDSFTNKKFNIDVEKKRFVDDLEKLVRMGVEEFTFYKKFEEIKLLIDSKNDCIMGYETRAKAKIWAPTDLNDEELTIREINELQPRMVLASNDKPEPLFENDLERLWTTMRIYCSSAEYNQAPGRFFKFFLIDDVSNKVLGICSVASDVIAISDRDKYIGWTSEDKLVHKMLKYSAIGTTIVPTQPFGTNFLGGKLTAAMVTSDAVRKAWETKSGEGMECKLVGMTTTSLYGNKIVDKDGTKKGNFSMYNGLKWWKPVGMSKGKIPIKPLEKAYFEWHKWLKQHRTKEYDKAMTQKEDVKGPVTGAKMRVLSMIFKECNISQSDYVHGFERGVYYSCFYENTKEFLCRKITEDKLMMKPLFKDDTKSILDWWKPKAIERYKKLKADGRLNPEKLFYNQITGDVEYDEAKKLYFNDVGR